MKKILALLVIAFLWASVGNCQDPKPPLTLTIKSDKQDGLYKEYHETGQLSEEGTRKDGKREGPFKRYNREGPLLEEGTFKDGRRNGPSKFYNDKGQLAGEATYKDGKLNGPFKWYHGNGQLLQEGTSKDDKRVGLCREYYENGQLSSEGTYQDGKREGLFKEYSESGYLKTEETYKDGTPEGPFKSYYENGKVRQEGIRKCGREDGQFKFYTEDGQLLEEGTYKDGWQDGPYKRYNNNGQLSGEGTYKGGLQDGPYKRYYENGQLSEEGTYKNDKKEGLCKEYYENGELRQEGTFKNDEPEGPFKIYSGKGQLEQEGIMKNGKREGQYKSYSENGELREAVVYKDGEEYPAAEVEASLEDKQSRVLEEFIFPPVGTKREFVEKVYGESTIKQDDYGTYSLLDGSYQLDVRYDDNIVVETFIPYNAREVPKELSVSNMRGYINTLKEIKGSHSEKLKDASWNNQDSSLTIKSDKQVCEVGDEIKLEAILNNNSDKEMIIFWSDKKPVIFSEESGVYIVAMYIQSDGETLYIKPKENLSKVVSVILEEKMTSIKGKIWMQFLYDARNMAIDFKRRLDQEIFTGNLISNPITIELVPGQGITQDRAVDIAQKAMLGKNIEIDKYYLKSIKEGKVIRDIPGDVREVWDVTFDLKEKLQQMKDGPVRAGGEIFAGVDKNTGETTIRYGE